MCENLRVVVLSQYFPPDVGGGSTRASNVVKGLLSKGCKVTVVTAFPHYPHGNVPRSYRGKPIVSETFGAAKVYRVWVPSLPHTNPLKRMVLHLCFVISSLFALPFVGRYNVVWGANPNLFSFIPSLLYSSVKRVPIVRNVDDLWPEVFYELGLVRSKSIQKALDLFAWFSYVVPAAITPISEGYKRLIISKYHVPSEKIHVIEVGVETVEPLNSHILKTPFTVMYSGALSIGYDFDVLLRCARLLDAENINFIIRGSGELASKLKKAVEDWKLKNVFFDVRFLSQGELCDLLSSANIFVLPMANLNFVDLGLPTKVFEYQSYGKPIVCVSNGEVAKYIESTNSGLIVKPRDAEGLAQAILSLYDNSDLARSLGINGRSFVSKHLTSKRIGERMYNLFFLLISKTCEP